MSTADASGDSEGRDAAWQEKLTGPRGVRLLAALIDARRRRQGRGARLDAGSVERCDRLLRLAEEEVGRGRHYVAWDCLHQVDEELLAALDDDERRARWHSLNAEAKKKLKDSWRGDAVEQIAKLAPSADERVPLHLLREVQSHLHTAAQNQQHKLDLFERQSLPWLAASLAAAVVVVLTGSFLALALAGRAPAAHWVQPLAPWAAAAGPWAQAFALGIPAGALGGMLSMAFTLGRGDLKASIPDMRLSWKVTATRPLLGAAVAIPMAVLVQAGLVSVARLEGPFAVFAFCFLGGFSERWFLGVVERLEGGRK